MAEEWTFEKAMTRLEQIVGVLESGRCTLDDSLKLFEEGDQADRLLFQGAENGGAENRQADRRGGAAARRGAGAYRAGGFARSGGGMTAVPAAGRV